MFLFFIIINYLIQLADLLAELSRREIAANIKPDADIDVFMKVREAKT